MEEGQKAWRNEGEEKCGKRGDQRLPEAGRRDPVHVWQETNHFVIPDLVSDWKERRVSGIHS
jgi:hypothetical protein